MVAVTTVLGDVDETELGLVLPHEHLMANAAPQWTPPADPAELKEALRPVEAAILGRSQLDHTFYRSILQVLDPLAVAAELQEFADVGGRTVVDLSPAGFGRDPVASRAISQLTGLNIVMGTGEYREIAHSSYVAVSNVDQIAEVMVSELTDGVGKTGIRAGIIGEIGSSNPVTDAEKKVLRAAAKAQQATGVALNIHRSVFPDPDACLVALDLVLDEGVDPSRVVMSHCDERPEAETALEVARRGAFVECDTFGMERWAMNWQQDGHPVERSHDRDRIAILKTLLDAGFLDQLLLSQDVCMQSQLVRNGGWGYAHISRNIEPRLKAGGVTDADLMTLRVENPRRLLAGART